MLNSNEPYNAQKFIISNIEKQYALNKICKTTYERQMAAVQEPGHDLHYYVREVSKYDD